MSDTEYSLAGFDSFADDLLSEKGVRPLVLVGASKIDLLLMKIIEGYLLPKISRPREQDELLGIDYPLGTFSSRIRMCRRLGFLDETLYAALEKVRTLRNLCAHSINFDHRQSPVRDHIVDLRKAMSTRESFKLTRQKYFMEESLSNTEELQCLLLTVCVLLQGILNLNVKVSPNTDLIRVSAK